MEYFGTGAGEVAAQAHIGGGSSARAYEPLQSAKTAARPAKRRFIGCAR
jgi:hypothetical protein